MSDITYSDSDYDNPEEVHRLGEIHERTPLNWDPDYQVLEERIANWVRFVEKSREDPHIKVLVARAGAEIVGMHWILIKEEGERKTAQIDSLWVHEDYRGRGIAGRLKELGEEWARSNGAESIKTAVFYDNKRMLEFNMRRGFKALQVEMVKKLSQPR